MNFNTITKRLKESRAVQKKQDADEARAFFENRPDDAREFFGYTKSGTQRAMTTNEKIARKWRKLKEKEDVPASSGASELTTLICYMLLISFCSDNERGGGR